MSRQIHGRKLGPPKPEVVNRLREGVERLLGDGRTYAEIGIEDLVREGGLARSTFYAHFADKDALLRTIAAQIVEELVDYEKAWWTLPPEASRAEVHDALTAMYQAYASYGPLMPAIVDAAIYDAQMRMQFAELVQGSIDSTAAYIRRGQKAGVIPASVDATRTATWLNWAVERGFNRLLPGVAGDARERKLQAMTEVIWRGSRGGEG